MRICLSCSWTQVSLLIVLALLGIGLYKLEEDIRVTVEEVRKSVPELVGSHGYPLEEHFMTTSDGYILLIHRIPSNQKGKQGPPVLLGHGSSMGSTGFLLGHPKDHLGYVLADNGFDVWLINNRGNSFSRNSSIHKDISTSSKAFWDFGFEEMSLIDYPETIDFILKKTKQKSLFFIGISQGASQYLALLSDLPAYNAKIRAGVLLAPAIYVNSSAAFAFRFAPIGCVYKYIVENLLGRYEAWMTKDFLLWGAHRFCSSGAPLHDHCPYLGSLFYGNTTFNYDELPAIADLLFQGSSYRSYDHFSQWYKSNAFQKYDFGSEEANLQRYGVPYPPLYDLCKVTAKTHFILGGRDEVVVLEDGLRLLSELVSAKTSKKVLFDYTHTDFVASTHSKSRLYPSILKYLRKAKHSI